MSDKELIAEALRWANGHPNRRSGELMRELADALEARQPGGDDREVLARLLAAQDGEEWDRLVGTAEYARNRYLRKAGAILDRMPKLSRAAVPDAATELRAERDAALAAIERVREIHRNAGPSQGYDQRFKGDYGMLGDCCAACGSHGEYGVEWPCPTVASLDGVPEPEGKP